MMVLHIYRTTIILNQIFETIITIQKLRFCVAAKRFETMELLIPNSSFLTNKKLRFWLDTKSFEAKFQAKLVGCAHRRCVVRQGC